MRTRTSQQLYKNPRWLFEQYWVENLSTIKLARMCDVAPCTIKRHMRKYEIAARTVREAHQLNYDPQPYWNRDWLYKKYWKQGLSMNKIAKLCGRNRTTIEDWMSNHEIPKRRKEEWQLQVVAKSLRRNHPSLVSRFKARIKEIVGRFDVYMRTQDN